MGIAIGRETENAVEVVKDVWGNGAGGEIWWGEV